MNPAFDSGWNSYVKDSMPIVAAVIGAFGGGIISGFLVHVLTQSREREKWILDSKKQEYRELLSALSDGHVATGRLPFVEADEKAILMAKQIRSFQIFTDRIFTAHDLDLKGLRNKWLGVANKYGTPNSPWNELEYDYEAIRDEIVKAANRAIPKTTWQRLQFWKD